MQDEDSEAEKLSPLLQNSDNTARNNHLALNMVDVVDSIDDADTDQEEPTHTTPVEKNKKSGKITLSYFI